MKHLSTIAALALFSLTTVNCTPVDTTATDTARRAATPEEYKTQKVSILRDAYGVPSVTGQTDEAAMYGLGWVSAQDRLYQMNVTMLVAQGRTAEYFGNDNGQLKADKKARITGIWHAAQKTAEQMDPKTVALLQAYAKGVNDYAASHASDLHPQFAATGLTPQRWTPAHSIAAWRAITGAYSTSGLNEGERLEEFEADVDEFGEEQAIESWLDFHRGDPEAGVVQAEDLTDDYIREVNEYAASMGYNGERSTSWGYTGEDVPHFSHAYALAGTRTTTGEAILVSDPQVPVLMPAFWYEFHIQSPSFSARGIGAPGTPGVAIGFNESVAWGITAGSGDQADLFRLKTDRAAAGHYIIDGVEYPIETVEEEILIAGGSSSSVLFRTSQWGPVVTDLLDPDLQHEYALRNVNWADGDRSTLEGMFGMMRAHSLDELKSALDDWRAPVVNLIAADAEGDVYYSLIGGIPVRAQNAPLGGMIAQDGSTNDSAWQDIMPHRVLPQVTSPASGTVYSGNHRAAGAWYPLPLGTPVATGGHSNRSRRLRDLLETGRTFSPRELITDVQLDCVDPAREGVVRLGRHIAQVAPGSMSGKARNVLALLDDWYLDGATMLTDQDTVLLASRLQVNFRVGLTGAELQTQYGGGGGGMNLFLDHMFAELADNPRFKPEPLAIAYIESVLTDALDNVSPNQDTWRDTYLDEKAIQNMEYHKMFNKLEAGDGSSYTTEPLPCAHGNSIWAQPSQSYSHVVDFADSGLSVLPPGNSEHSGPGLTNQSKLWVNGRFKPAPADLRSIAAGAVSTETLSYSNK